jgi:hypothetical protein
MSVKGLTLFQSNKPDDAQYQDELQENAVQL